MVKLMMLALLVSSVNAQRLLPISPPTHIGARLLPYQSTLRTNAKPMSALPSEFHGVAAGERELPSRAVENSPEHSLSRRTVGKILGGAALGTAFGYPQTADAAGDRKLITFDADKDFKRLWSSRGGYENKFSPGGKAPDPNGRTPKDKKGETELSFTGEAGSPDGSGPLVAWTQSVRPYGDLSSCEGLYLIAKTAKPYSGYELGLGVSKSNIGVPVTGPFSFAYKAKFEPPTSEYGQVKIPFKDFAISDPELLSLTDIKRISLWAVDEKDNDGKFDMKVKEIGAYGCGSVTELAAFDVPVSTNIRWYFAAGTVGFMAFLLVDTRRKSAPVTQPLLG